MPNVSSPSSALRSEAGLNSPVISNRRSSGGSSDGSLNNSVVGFNSGGGGKTPNDSSRFTMREVQQQKQQHTPGGDGGSAVPAALASLLHQSDRSGRQNEASPSLQQRNASSPSERRSVVPESNSGNFNERRVKRPAPSFWESLFSCCISSSALPIDDRVGMATSSSSSSSSSMSVQRGGASVVSPARNNTFSVRHEALDVRMGGDDKTSGEGDSSSTGLRMLGDEEDDLTNGTSEGIVDIGTYY